jgi:hypothetical protein
MLLSNHAFPVVQTLCILFTLSASTHAEPLVVKAESGREKVAVLELYTSEGCSSCPPADRFVSRLGESARYPKQVIPLSFHVTYWDYIGWRDVYAQKAFDKRQSDIAARRHSRSIYTPQLVLDGKDTRGFGRLERQLRDINRQQPAAGIRLQAHTDNERVRLDVRVDVTDASRRPDAGLYVALFENNINSRVGAGENRGKTLEHDHIVREFLGPLALPSAQAESHHELSVDVPAGVNLSNAGIAVFVQNTSDGSVLQALAVPLVTPSVTP